MEVVKKDFFKVVILSCVAVHLFAVNSNLLANLTVYFKVDNRNLQIFLTIFFSGMYSLGTVYSLNRSPLVWLKVVFAIFDGIAVKLWYDTTITGNIYIELVSTFYATYTVLVALGVGIKAKPRENKTVEVSDKPEFLSLYIYGYAMYVKWLYNKSKSENKLDIAKKCEEFVNEFDNTLDPETEGNFTIILEEMQKLMR